MANASWIKIAPNGRYFCYDDGRPFFSVGHGEAFGFFFQAMNPKETLRAFFSHLAGTGQNTLLCQVENEDLDFYGGHRLSLEGPLGHYDEAVARQFDELLELAREHGIYVITYLWDTFHMDFNWDKSPYNVVNGGPCRYVSDMLRDPVAREWQKQKFRWAIDRWGNHPNLFAWELMNEIEWAVAGAVPANAAGPDDPLAIDMEDPINRRPGRFRLGSDAEMAAWVSDMGAFVRGYGRERWGRAHLQTVSTNNPRYGGAWFYDHPEVDFLTSHQYVWEGDQTTNPDHPLTAAFAARDIVRDSLDRGLYRRPYMDTEHGPLGFHLANPTEKFPFDDALFDAMTWANWAAGAAGGGLRWPYPNYGFGGKPHLNPLSRSMEKTLSAMLVVCQDVDWESFNSRPADHRLAFEDEAVKAIASADSRQLIAWIVHDDRVKPRAPEPAELILSGLSPGAHAVTFYDPKTGMELFSETYGGPTAYLMTPAFSRDLVMVVTAAA